MLNLSRDEARRAALFAQGLATTPPVGRNASWPRIERAIRTMNLLQIDSVNVITRSHYLPVLARTGGYRPETLDRATLERRSRKMFEYWAHEASFLPMDLYPLLRWRMDDARKGTGIYKDLAKFGEENPVLLAEILTEAKARKGLKARDLGEPGTRSGEWWGWNTPKMALEYLFWTGDLTAAAREGFERVYDLPERVIEAEHLNAAIPSRAASMRALVERSARALGIAAETDLRDYFRLPLADARAAISELVESGTLQLAAVEGWKSPAYLHKDAEVPGRATGTALLSPFDPLVWNRSRAERVFGFRYRIEIYTPAHKREYGYYVLPFLHRGRMAGRVCLKADRQKGLLRVNQAHLERGHSAHETAHALAGKLDNLADWLGLAGIAVSPGGDLAGELKSAVSAL